VALGFGKVDVVVGAAFGAATLGNRDRVEPRQCPTQFGNGLLPNWKLIVSY
jgi:hypothetical protein